MTTRRRVLVIYAADHWPLRTAVADHLLAFARDPGIDAVYHNALRRPLSGRLVRTGFDVAVLHTTFLAQRWQPTVFAAARRNIAALAHFRGPKVALPQDEFLHTDVLCEVLAELGIQLVLSCAELSEWPKIYGSLDPQPAFRTVLTGYLEPATIRRVEQLAAAGSTRRTIDIGYRAWRAQPWLGRHGMLKTEIAEVVTAEAPAHGLSLDVSLEERQTLIGDAWLRFLLRCRWTLGVEGGASILDADGSVKACTEALLAAQPEAAFEDVERACFAGRDGELSLFALSPRHLEACATRTGQILVRGHYNGVLQPGTHYLALEPDFGNLAEVLEAARDEPRRRDMAEAAFRDVVAGDRYSYRKLTSEVVAATPAAPRTSDRPGRYPVIAGTARAWDRVDRLLLRVRPTAVATLRRLGLLGLVHRARARMRRTPGQP